MKICIILTTRGNYAKFKRFIELAENEPGIEIQKVINQQLSHDDVLKSLFVAGATRFIDFSIKDDNLFGMGESAGLVLAYFSGAFRELQPDLVMFVGDRWETHSAATAAYLCGIPIAHLEGGELSGSLDHHLRYSISELSTYHFPCTDGAAWRLNDRRYDNIHMVGATSIDVLANAKLEFPLDIGDPKKPFFLVIQHPDTSNYDKISEETNELFMAIADFGISAIWIGPNVDAGSEIIRHIAGDTRHFFAFYDSLPIEQYGYLLKHAACIVGNSSSGIRESCFFGTPNVSVGKRQDNREHGGNTVFVEAERNQIIGAVKAQMLLGHSEPIYTYGDGHASEKILEVIKSI